MREEKVRKNKEQCLEEDKFLKVRSWKKKTSIQDKDIMDRI